MAGTPAFTSTNVINGRVLTDGAAPTYQVHIDGEFWGYVNGEKGYFRAMSQHGFTWGPSKRTRAHAVEAAKTSEMIAVQTTATPPEGSIEVRVTEHNLHEVIKPGDILFGAEDLGPVVSVRLTQDRYRNAMVTGTNNRDILGLPSTVHITRS